MDLDADRTEFWPVPRAVVLGLCGPGSIVCLSAAAGLSYSAFRLPADDRTHPIGVLMADEVVLRKGDGDTYEPQFNRSLGAGIEFRVIEQGGDWLKSDCRTGEPAE